jgi:hypothetical protein
MVVEGSHGAAEVCAWFESYLRAHGVSGRRISALVVGTP